jgi:hypothetical protein
MEYYSHVYDPRFCLNFFRINFERLYVTRDAVISFVQGEAHFHNAKVSV